MDLDLKRISAGMGYNLVQTNILSIIMKNIFKSHRTILFFLLVTVLSDVLFEPAETRGKITATKVKIFMMTGIQILIIF